MILVKGTLFSLNLETVGAETAKYQLNMLGMFFYCFREDKNVININNDKLIQKVMQNIIHEALESSRGIGEAKWHNLELKEAIASTEGSFIFFTLSYANKFISPSEIYLTIDFGRSETV